MKTNLLLLDSYKNIENLISYAFSFTEKYNLYLKIVYVFDFDWMRQSYMVGTGGTVAPSLVTVEKNARKEFDIAEDKIRQTAEECCEKNAVNVNYDVAVSQINRIDLVNEELKNEKDILLMISSHQSYTEASGGLVGYPNIIDHVSCPVFVIPDSVSKPELQNVLYATDFNPEDIRTIKHLSEFIGGSENSKITVLHNEEDFGFDEQLKWYGFQKLVNDEVSNATLDFKLEKNKDFLKGVGEYIENNDLDLLVVLKEKKGFFEQIFSSSDTRNLLTNFSKPVLVYHDESLNIK